ACHHLRRCAAYGARLLDTSLLGAGAPCHALRRLCSSGQALVRTDVTTPRAIGTLLAAWPLALAIARRPLDNGPRQCRRIGRAPCPPVMPPVPMPLGHDLPPLSPDP